MGRLIYLKNVVSLRLDEEKCVGCGMCVMVCPHGVLVMNDGRARIEERDACMECGACARNCPTEAVSVRPGVGCATAVINAALGRADSACRLAAPAGATILTIAPWRKGATELPRFRCRTTGDDVSVSRRPRARKRAAPASWNRASPHE